MNLDKKKTIVPIKRSASVWSRKHRVRGVAINRASAGLPPPPGLPAARLQTQDTSSATNDTADRSKEAEFLDSFDDGSGVEPIPCECLLAMQELQRAKEGLAIPLEHDGGSVIHGILECQIQELFLQQRGSSKSLSLEIEQALENNLLRRVASSNEQCPDVFLTKEDYAIAVRDTLQNDKALCDWFLEGLDDWGKSVLPRSTLESLLHKTPTFRLCSAKKIQELQERRVLLSVSSQHDAFKLFLPTWGNAVIPAFRKAQSDGVMFLKQAKQRKERSLSSFVNRLGRSPIPIARVLVPWMVAQGLVKRVERPSGLFIALAD